MDYSKIYFKKDNSVMKVVFNNPEKLNALTAEFIKEMNCLLDEIEADENLQVIILTGEGKAFIAGADISAMKTMTPAEAIKYASDTTEIYRRMEESKKIFIAAINGYALGGGCELALACDLRIASMKAKFGLPETGLGIFPGGGGTQRLPRLIGMARAKELVYTGKTISASKAYEIGLVNEVIEHDELMHEAENLAFVILKNSKSGVSLAKESLNKGMQMDIVSAINLEKNLFGLCFATEDQKVRMSAFFEKKNAKSK
ncbi:enoyl-CoA hydratase [Dethiosulfatibacter aminovorans DSM 17477]|uniref:Enoyl-CoA hydratase n=1 Tax=Dethiosulfatibacter aminovorans DSM 17477 TaxID=1121476 RepID=A0A1M6ENM6_9FIRM|nr:enoyl-CoA hydratase-related protein [Dethiosulfatibacter aminovorans]SHI87082.1 enoyl-CoA hydratase [Dethiosulfatibacter aminovorans DSM 17477]